MEFPDGRVEEYSVNAIVENLGELGGKQDFKFIPIKATINQLRKYEGAYCGLIHRVTQTGELRKNPIKIQPSKNSAVPPRKRGMIKNEDWDNKTRYTRSAASCDPRI